MKISGNLSGSRPFLLAASALCAVSATAARASDDRQAPAGASAAADQGPQPSEIVVTALKRSTGLQRTPLAITAVTGQTLATMGVTGTSSLARVSPGLVIRESGQSGVRLTIRNIEAAGEATVGLYYDETPVVGSSGVNSDAGGTTPNVRLFDVDRVEVLRGPQGTLYGSSSMAGTVRLIFAKPELARIDGAVDGELSGTAHGGLDFGTRGMINIPLIEDKLAVRAVGFYDHQAGYIDNVHLERNHINRQRSEGGRVMVRAQPVAGVTIDGLAVIQNLNGSLNDYLLSQGAYKNNYESLQPAKDRYEIFSGTVNWDLGAVKITAIGAHSYRYFDYTYDFSAFFRGVGAFFPAGSPINLAYLSQAPAAANSPQITRTNTAELRASSSGHGPFQWTVGVFYSKRDGDFTSQNVHVDPATGMPSTTSAVPASSPDLNGQRVISDQLQQKAAFGEATYDLTDRLSATAGIRYFAYDRQVYGLVTKPDALIGFAAGPATNQSASENGFLYKGNLSYKPTNRIMAYATVSSGERPGGINQNVSLPADLQSYSSDKLWNYEFGIKSQFFDRRLTFNADIFEMDWKNMQTSGTLPNTAFAFITNAGAAQVRGTEIEAALTPYAGLQLQISGSYIDARLRQDQANQNLLAAGLKGDPIPFVPKATAQTSLQYGWTLGSAIKALVHADASYNGASWNVFHHTNAYQQRLPAYATLNMRAGISGADDDWSLAVFIDNALNSSAVVTKLSSIVYGSLNNVRAISLTPRTAGIQLSKHF